MRLEMKILKLFGDSDMLCANKIAKELMVSPKKALEVLNSLDALGILTIDGPEDGRNVHTSYARRDER